MAEAEPQARGPLPSPTPDRPRVLVVDDEPMVLHSLRRLLASERYEISTFEDPTKGMQAVESGEPDLVIVDLMLPGADGIELCKRIKGMCPDTEVIVMSGHGSIETAVSAMKAGAYDFVVKPFPHVDVVRRIVARALERKRLADRARNLERQVGITDRFERIVGRSAKMREVFRLIESVAETDATVLITGESGTGKELVARSIHDRSRRRSGRFVAVNCSALVETLLESELFGHVRGAFTGAVASRRGIFEEATEGTVFLDEIGDTSPSMQARLLRVLQEGEVRAVGASDVRKVDVRVVCATNADLDARVREGGFREDLFYRINVIRVELPPLRERTDDLLILAAHFLRKHAAKTGKGVSHFSPQALAALERHHWRGNVRELENVVERAVVLARGDTIAESELGLSPGVAPRHEPRDFVDADRPFPEAKRDAIVAFERAYIEEILRRGEGNVAKAARLAGLDRNNFRRLMARLGLSPTESS